MDYRTSSLSNLRTIEQPASSERIGTDRQKLQPNDRRTLSLSDLNASDIRVGSGTRDLAAKLVLCVLAGRRLGRLPARRVLVVK